MHPSTAAAPAAAVPPRGGRWLRRILIALAILIVAVVLIVLFFPWDVLRGPINRYVSEKTGRRFEITRHLDVKPGLRTARITLDGIEFDNPRWARDPLLVGADKAEIDIRIWPLLRKQVDIPRLMLSAPRIGLQMEEDGRKTWALEKGDDGEAGRGSTPRIGVLQVDGGHLDFLAKHLGVDMRVDFAFDTQKGDMPLSYQMKGRYQSQPLSAQGRTGNVLLLTQAGVPPFPFEIHATAGGTRLDASGSMAALTELDGVDAKVRLKGRNLGDLYRLIGVALPDTSPYQVEGRLLKTGNTWQAQKLSGKLGLSDIGGELQFEKGASRPKLSGKLASKVMDMDDLGPLIGLPPTERSAKAVDGVEAPVTLEKTRRRGADVRVLPTAPLDFERLRAMDADVRYTAERIRNVREVPLQRGSVQVALNDGVLALKPLDLGVAGGSIQGAVRIDGSRNPADIRMALDVKALQLNQLIPKVESTKSSLGRLDGRINLAGQGTSVANWLGAASGDVAAMTGRGQFSNLLLEIAGLDGGEVLEFLLRGDKNVRMRCAALAFDVNKGVMNGRTLIFDTDDTLFTATGQASLKDETLDFVIRPQPKDKSILSLRTPLTVRGHFGDPRPGVEAAPLVARGAAALALGAINPLLALAATVETGPGEDADCAGALAEARRPESSEAAKAAERAKAVRR
ncbi:uncharacterized protein involved in outer membrane biogenesis [Pseudacidovorax sp. 1753]|uniref:AsmA family protein n=1 Tax=Pseudacidovorax sp. 1753 TaxID=3156419 RepID=UPI0033919D39